MAWIMNCNRFNSRLFKADIVERTLSINASELGEVAIFLPVNEHSMDIGFVVYTPRSILTVTWVLHNTVMNQENTDVDHWVCYVSNHSLALYPHLKDWTVIIYND